METHVTAFDPDTSKFLSPFFPPRNSIHMLTDALFDRLVRRLKRNRHQQDGEPSLNSSRMKKGEPTVFCFVCVNGHACHV